MRADLALGKLAVANTPLNIDRIRCHIEMMQAVQPRPGRFSLRRSGLPPGGTLILFDSETGRAWRYEIRAMEKNGTDIRSDAWMEIGEAPASAP